MNNNLVQLACFIIFCTCLKEDEDLGIVLMWITCIIPGVVTSLFTWWQHFRGPKERKLEEIRIIKQHTVDMSFRTTAWVVCAFYRLRFVEWCQCKARYLTVNVILNVILKRRQALLPTSPLLITCEMKWHLEQIWRDWSEMTEHLLGWIQFVKWSYETLCRLLIYFLSLKTWFQSNIITIITKCTTIKSSGGTNKTSFGIVAHFLIGSRLVRGAQGQTRIFTWNNKYCSNFGWP